MIILMIVHIQMNIVCMRLMQKCMKLFCIFFFNFMKKCLKLIMASQTSKENKI